MRLRLGNFFSAKSDNRFFSVDFSFPNNKSDSLHHSGAFTRKCTMFEVSLTILYLIYTLLQRVTVTILSYVPSSIFATGSWCTYPYLGLHQRNACTYSNHNTDVKRTDQNFYTLLVLRYHNHHYLS